MLHLKNIVRYEPEVVPEAFEGFGVVFFRSEDGTDFYQAVPDFQEDTMKVLYNKDYNITGFSKDASSLYPADASLVELPSSEVPKDLALGEDFIFDPVTKKIVKDAAAILEQEKVKGLNLAKGEIDALQDKIDTDTATDADLESMKAWKKYRVAVREALTQEDMPPTP